MAADLARTRVDQIGSLLRPQALKDAFLAHAKGDIDAATLHAAEDAAIRRVVAEQEACGLPVVSDGEYRRLNWQVSFSHVHGWDLWAGAWQALLREPENAAADEKPMTRGRDAVVSYRVPATDRLRLIENFPLREYEFLASVATRPAKAMLMGPDRVAQMCDIDGSRPIYADLPDFLADTARVQSEMVAGLAAAGCPYIQLDEPSYTGYVDAATLDRLTAQGTDPIAQLEQAIAATNTVLAAAGAATTAVHICRGNRASMWHREGTYDAIAERLFGGLNCDRLLLEYDSEERSGDFRPLAYVPKGVTVVLGLITTKEGTVETVDGLRRRLDDAARHCPLEQLAISPQCGFASGIAGNRLSEASQWRKLEVMLETAEKVWGSA